MFRDYQNIDLHRELTVLGQSGFDSRRAQSLSVCSFATIQATNMYFTFLKVSNLYLFAKDLAAL